MNKELSKNLMCIKIGEIEIWAEVEKIKHIISILSDKNAPQFIQVEDEIINRSYITGIFKAKTMEDLTRRKNGYWKCKWNYWHAKNEQCAHGEVINSR